MSIICKIFGHSMVFTEFADKGIASHSKCRRCGYDQPGVEWPHPPMPKIKRKKVKYGILTKFSQCELTVEVNAALDLGWELQGGVAVTEGVIPSFSQAVAKIEYVDE